MVKPINLFFLVFFFLFYSLFLFLIFCFPQKKLVFPFFNTPSVSLPRSAIKNESVQRPPHFDDFQLTKKAEGSLTLKINECDNLKTMRKNDRSKKTAAASKQTRNCRLCSCCWQQQQAVFTYQHGKCSAPPPCVLDDGQVEHLSTTTTIIITNNITISNTSTVAFSSVTVSYSLPYLSSTNIANSLEDLFVSWWLILLI